MMTQGGLMDFYDLCVRPKGDLEGIIGTAERFGFEGLGIMHKYGGEEDLDTFLKRMGEKEGEIDLDLVRCCEINPESPEELKKILGKVRERVEAVGVTGGNFDLNKAAVRDSRVDLLLHPEHKRKDGGMDHKTARMASENEVAIGIVLHSLFQTYGKVRSHVLNHIRKNIELCEEYNADIVVGSGARDRYELRDPRELASLPRVLGMSSNESMETVSSIPSEMVEENREKLERKGDTGGV